MEGKVTPSGSNAKNESEQDIANKKRKRPPMEEGQEHEDELEKIGKLNAGGKIRRTESLEKNLQAK